MKPKKCFPFPKIFWANLFFSATVHFSSAQVNGIKGQVWTASDSVPIELVSVILESFEEQKIISYTLTDANGRFILNDSLLVGVYVLKLRHLGYQTLEQRIFIDGSTTQFVDLKFYLEENVNDLAAVTVKASPPIVVKEDTIIYDIQHWTSANDQNLEQVLSKIQGFKILANGEIEIKGKQVRKVLINGEELANTGAALLTKSIDPNDVDKIEVRLDEQSSKLKESLLEAKDFVVLDIKLKPELDLSFFGKAQATLGVREKVEPGWYANTFSLFPKAKFHIFTEGDNFGHQTISLRNIRNLGREAWQKLFELPTDFESIKAREGFDSEIFGFNDFIQREQRILGISSKFNLTDHLDLYIGSFNTEQEQQQRKSVGQSFQQGSQQKFTETVNSEITNSKNKVELTYNAEKLKVQFNSNLIYNEAKDQSNTVFVEAAQENEFSRKQTQWNWYNNFFLEYLLPNNRGIQFKVAQSDQDLDRQSSLIANNPDLATIFSSVIQTEAGFSQDWLQRIQHFSAQALFQSSSPLGLIEVGHLIESHQMTLEAMSNENRDQADLIFVQNNELYHVLTNKPFIKHYLELGKLSLVNEVGLSFLSYPNLNNERREKIRLDYSGRVSFEPQQNFGADLSYQNRLASFPLHKVTAAGTLIDFQTVELAAAEISPQQESLFTLNLNSSFPKSKIDIDLGILAGQNFDANTFLFSSLPLILTQRSQLRAQYMAFSLTIDKVFRQIPLRVILEPEAVVNESQNFLAGQAYFIRTFRQLLGLKMNLKINKPKLVLKVYPKYTGFLFRNSLDDSRSRQHMFSSSLQVEATLIEKYLYLNLGGRRVDFAGNSKGSFTDMNIRLSGKYRTWSYFFQISNLFNSQNFIRQEIFPTFFVDQQIMVFQRFIKGGIAFKIK